jgi:predicted short-subunit dehydrogenase-like oxidoreductase (DUF2520 family)
MVEPKKKVVLIGAGNLGTQLAKALNRSKHDLVQICSLNETSAKLLAQKLPYTSYGSVKDIEPDADIYIIATNDASIAKVARDLSLGNKMVVHTSGTVDMKVLRPASSRIGVLYPVQTFTRDINVDFKNIPLCLEANSAMALTMLKHFARPLSNNLYEIDSEKRKTIHLAAVFVNNFTNHMYSIAHALLSENNSSLDILRPLITETARKVNENIPAKMQTGPAARGDQETMMAQIKLLEGHKDYQEIYKLLSQSIIHSTITNNK